MASYSRKSTRNKALWGYPVSYTHLPSSGTWYVCFADISGYPEFESHLAINGVLFGTSGDIPFAVSYTHLDVYKRQTLEKIEEYWRKGGKPRHLR